LGGRDRERIERAASMLGGYPLVIDVTDDASVAAAGEAICRRSRQSRRARQQRGHRRRANDGG
jgi:NADP-dependent 3-hydroxy acid dehydrogenase YdfG